jgi:hypothetical protein
MEERRLPKEVLEWRPSGRRKRGRPKLIGLRGLEEGWEKRGYRRKIGLIETIGGGRLHNAEMGAGRCGNIVQPAK